MARLAGPDIVACRLRQADQERGFMQFLLTAVNAKYIHSNPAVYSLRAYAGKELQPYIELAEYTINQRMEEILGDLYRRHPRVIGFSCYIWNISLIKELLKELPKVLPGTDLWLGGPEVSFEAEKLLKEFPELKGIMAGEGEETFKELLTFYVNKEECREDNYSVSKKLEDIPGLVLQSGSTAVRELMDMDKLPFLYAAGNHEDGDEAGAAFHKNLQEFENRIIYYETSRGCPFRCGYCLSSIDKRVRLRSLETVKRELAFFLDQRVPQVKLIDRTFNCNHCHAMEIWQYLKDHDNGVTNFHFEVAADIMDEEEIRLLQSMRPGQAQLEIGVQTTNGAVLTEIGRARENSKENPLSIAKIREAVCALQKSRNIHIHLDLIAGLPLEDYESFRNSFNQVYAMKPDQLQLGFLKVLKGTAIWEKAGSYGIAYQERPPYEVLYTRWISYEEILKLKQVEEMVELYYNSGQFTHTLRVLEGEFATPFDFFERLAEFYERKGYFIRTPARSHRYQVLLEFAVETAPEEEGLWRELLTFDLYLREKAKSRPAFGRDLSPYREEIWEIYLREEKEPELLKAYSHYHARQTMGMTHMEVFFYPVWEEAEEVCRKRREEPAFVLFDYGKRDALNGNAQVWVAKG